MICTPARSPFGELTDTVTVRLPMTELPGTESQLGPRSSQLALQVAVLGGSHCSPDSTTPLPHTGGGGGWVL